MEFTETEAWKELQKDVNTLVDEVKALKKRVQELEKPRLGYIPLSERRM